MISYEEISGRRDKLGNGQIVKSGMRTLTYREEYRKSGKDKKNALKYERAYTKLLDKVKNKPHDEKVQFLIDHMSELRTIVDIFSYARDMSMFPHTYFSLTEHNYLFPVKRNFNDEVLANLLIYRYENHISILDDNECQKSRDYLKELIHSISMKNALYQKSKKEELAKEHPDDYAEYLNAVKKEFVEFGHSIQKLNEKLKDKTLTIEDFL